LRLISEKREYLQKLLWLRVFLGENVKGRLHVVLEG
jgi:hypothetical protein